MACRGFSGYRGADEGRWVRGWTRASKVEKLERDAERTGEKLGSMLWFLQVRAVFIEEVKN